MKLKTKQVRHYKFKTLPWLTKRAQEVFNAYIRERDKLTDGTFKCISCGKIKKIKGGNYHAGHFYPAGQYQSLRFDERNVNGECVKCNYYSGDHLIGYRENLINKIGQSQFEELEMLAKASKRHFHKWDRLSLIYVINKYK